MQGVAEVMQLFVFAIAAGALTAEMLPGGTGETRLQDVCLLSMELLLVFDQHVRKLSRTDRHANRLQEVQDFWLAHPICIIESQDPRSDSRSKLTGVARWKSRQIRLLVAGRVIFFFAELDVLGTKRNVLHDHILIAAFPEHRQARVPHQPSPPRPGLCGCWPACLLCDEVWTHDVLFLRTAMRSLWCWA